MNHTPYELGQQPLDLDFDAIPKYLKERAQWLMWRSEQRGERRSKVPRQVDGRPAKSNDSATWSNLQSCRDALSAGNFDGIGFAFASGDSLCGIDLDHCITDGQLEPWAQEIVERFHSTYCEISPSKDGVHIWCRGVPIKTGQKKWKQPDSGREQGIEVYNHRSARYFTVTGQSICAPDITDCQSELDWLYEKYFADALDEPRQIRDSAGELRADVVQEALDRIDADDYQTWMQVGMALKNGGLDLAYWEAWSARSPKFVPGECDKKWNSFNGNGVTLGTLFHLAAQHGFQFPNQRGNEHQTTQIRKNWADPETFGQPISFIEAAVPEVGSDFLPRWVKVFVDALAAQTQTPVEMAAMLVLSVLAACIQKRYTVSPYGDEYCEPLSLWVLVAAPPASRKSAVLEALVKPLRLWEKERARELAQEIEEQKTKREVSEKRIEELKRQASKVEE